MAEEDALLALKHECGVCVVLMMVVIDPTVEQVRKRAKWDNDDYICKGLILNGMSDPLFDIYQNVETSKELWESLETKYMDEDASSKKFLVSDFTNYKIIDSRPVLEQYNKLLDFKHTLKHKKEELPLVELGSHLHIEESLRVQDNGKPKSNNVAGPSVVNMVEHNHSFRRKGFSGWFFQPTERMMMLRGGLTLEQQFMCVNIDAGSRPMSHYIMDIFFTWEMSQHPLLNIITDNIGSASILWHARLGHVHFKRMQDMFKDGETEVLELIHSDLCDLHATPSLGNKRDTNHTGGLVVPKEVTEEVVQQPEHELRKSKRNKTPKNFGSGFQLYLIEGTRDEDTDIQEKEEKES
ncbi:zinc finger, CCHC-type containing protein [Tanacetum coccineum]